MFLINTLMEDISVGTAGLVALLGYAVVFVGAFNLMCWTFGSRSWRCRSGFRAQGCSRTCHRHRRRMQAL